MTVSLRLDRIDQDTRNCCIRTVRLLDAASFRGVNRAGIGWRKRFRTFTTSWLKTITGAKSGCVAGDGVSDEVERICGHDLFLLVSLGVDCCLPALFHCRVVSLNKLPSPSLAMPVPGGHFKKRRKVLLHAMLPCSIRRGCASRVKRCPITHHIKPQFRNAVNRKQ